MWPDPEPEREVEFLSAAHTPGGNAAFHNFHNDFAHIINPNERRRLALSEVDKVPFGWYHVRAVSVAGAGFFADSYDLFAINLAIQMLGITFWQSNGGIIPTNVQTAIKAATSGGAVVGQIVFGWAADQLGRKKMYGVELMILLVSTLGQALSSPGPTVTIVGLLIFGRIVMGLGIGGDYPMSAIITSEFAPTRWRGAMMAAVFSMQGFGQFFAAIVALIITTCFRKSFSTALSFSTCQGDCQLAADRSWRIIIGFGMLPAIFALYYRITIPETPRFTFDVAQNVDIGYADIRAYIGPDAVAQGGFLSQGRTQSTPYEPLTHPRASWSDFRAYFSTWRNGSVLFATMASWFLVDFAFYGLGLNNTTILAVVGYSSGSNVYKILFNAAVGNLILVCAGAIPGYLLSVCMVDSLGRKPIQIGGFIILTLIFCIIGFGYNSLNKAALLALYILAQLFFNFGPNSTTFIIPGECFPTRYRSTCHGLSAASGKLGATIAQVIAQPLLRKGAAAGCKGSACSPWLDHLMQIFALFMFCGIFVSFLVPETKGLSLEVLAGEPPQARYGRTADQGSNRGVLSRLGLDVHFRDKKESGKNRTQKKGSHGGEREDHHSHMVHVVGDKDYSVHASNASSGGGTLRSYGQNEVANNDVQQWAESMPLQDVGKLLSALK